MILECPSCQARFEIGAGVNVVGRKVRCSRCAHVWQVQEDEAERIEAPQRHAGAVVPDPVHTAPSTPPQPQEPTPGAITGPDWVQQSQAPRQPVHAPGAQSAATHPAAGGPRSPQNAPSQSQVASAQVGEAHTAPRMEPSPQAPVRHAPPPVPHPQHSAASAQAANRPASAQALHTENATAPAAQPAAPPASNRPVPVPAQPLSEEDSGPPSQDPPSSAPPQAATPAEAEEAAAETQREAAATADQSGEDAASRELAGENAGPAEPVRAPSPDNETDASEPDVRDETISDQPSQDHVASAPEAPAARATQDDTGPVEADRDHGTKSDPSRDESPSAREASDDGDAERQAAPPDKPTHAQGRTSADRRETPAKTSEKPTEVGPETDALSVGLKAEQPDQQSKDAPYAEGPSPTATVPERQPKPNQQDVAPGALVAAATRVEPTFGGPAILQPEPSEPRGNSSLEAALGDMFATPLDHGERRVPLGAPDEPLDTQRSVGQIAERPPERSELAQGDHQPAGHADSELISAQDQVDYSSYGRERHAHPAAGEPTFSSPDEIAPDPSLERSHIDLRTDAPFATDFTQDVTQPIPSERRGRHVHADLHRRRAAINLGWFCLAAVVGSIIGIVTLGRDSVVRALPGAANFYAAVGAPVNTRGLDFADVSYDWTTEQGRPAISVKGKIRNVSNVPLDVPTVVFVLLDDRGDELYNWASRVREDPIAAGGEAAFTAQVPAPPGAARRLRVRFARKSR